MKRLILAALVVALVGCAECPQFDPATGVSAVDHTLQADVLIDSRLMPYKADDQRSYRSVGQSRIDSAKRGDVLP